MAKSFFWRKIFREKLKNEYLISISDDQLIIFWDILNSFSILTTTKTTKYLGSLVLLSDDLFITGSNEGSIQIWSTKLLGNEKMNPKK